MGYGTVLTVILPTHNHPSTLEFSIRSILQQSFRNFHLVVIGDGVKEETRTVVKGFMEMDNRIVFLDVPKSIRHGEAWRDKVIRDSFSEYIAYHGDDDLMLPDHLETLLSEIEGSNFIHSLPIKVGKEGDLNLFPTDISIQEYLDWYLSDQVHTSFSLTGVVHSRELYMSLPIGWEEAPIGIPSDLFMWKKFFASAGFEGKSSTASTTIKLDASIRVGMSDAERRAEIEFWWNKTQEAKFQITWRQLTQQTAHNVAARQFLRILNLEVELNRLKQSPRNKDTDQKKEFIEMNDKLKLQLSLIQNSSIWRTSLPLRVFIGALRKILRV